MDWEKEWGFVRGEIRVRWRRERGIWKPMGVDWEYEGFEVFWVDWL